MLDFGTSGNSQQVKFAKSNGTSVPAASWTSGAILRINNWIGTPVTGGGDLDQLIVGSDATGLNSAQLQSIHFTGYLTGATVLDVGSNNPGEVVPLTPLTVGDVNQDGHVTVADISALMAALSNIPVYQSSHPSLDMLDVADILDVNHDGQDTNNDVQALISFLANTPNGGGTFSAVPEPASFVLLAWGALALLVKGHRSSVRRRLLPASE